MTRPESFSHGRYLDAKRTVDDRALHRPTVERLREALADRAAADDAPVRVLEVGAGTGTMLRRLLAWDVLPGRVVYEGLDIRGAAVERARERTAEWTKANGYDVVDDGAHSGNGIDRTGSGNGVDGTIRFEGDGRQVTATFRRTDAFAFAAAVDDEWDLVIACGFLDLVELDTALEALLGLVPGGLAYFPITFDGETAFRPVEDSAFQRALLEAYHETMDDRNHAGASRTGRRLFDAVPEADGRIRAAGGSDWIVTPGVDGYPADEAYFLHYIVRTVEEAVDSLPNEDVRSWADRRHEQIANADLTYVAHQYDVLASVEETGRR